MEENPFDSKILVAFFLTLRFFTSCYRFYLSSSKAEQIRKKDQEQQKVIYQSIYS